MSRASLALWIALAANVAFAETATVIDPTRELESPKATAAAPGAPAQADAALKRERAEAEQRRRAKAQARAREVERKAAEKESARLRAFEQARQEAAAREAEARAAKKAAAAREAAMKEQAARQAAARKAAAVQAAIARASVAKATAARLAASREAARVAAARELAEREAAAREAAVRALAAREAEMKEEAEKQAAAKEAAAKEAAAKEAAAKALAAKEAADRLIAARTAFFRDNEIKRVSTRDASMLKEPASIGAAFRDCARCPELVWLPQGEFAMGDASAGAQRPTVAIHYRLAVGRFEVTFAEWDACVAAGGCRRRPHDAGWGHGWQPVINVSWVDAQQYAGWLSRSTGKRYRLLTEAEWEYAARAGTDVRYWWGDQAGRGDANCADCGSKWDGRQAAPVGRFAPNPFGLHDMHGNVAEWVEDCHHDCGAATNTRIVRGGGWFGSARSTRSTSRATAASDYADNGIGFRVGRTD